MLSLTTTTKNGLSRFSRPKLRVLPEQNSQLSTNHVWGGKGKINSKVAIATQGIIEEHQEEQERERLAE